MERRYTVIIRIITGGILLAAALMINTGQDWPRIILFLTSYILVGGDIVLRAIRNITKGKVFDENFLMSTATIGAMIINEYAEGIAVMLLYQIGELFQSYAVDKSRRSIADLMDIRPDYANVKKDGKYLKSLLMK